jgi:hypothetical protein
MASACRPLLEVVLGHERGHLLREGDGYELVDMLVLQERSSEEAHKMLLDVCGGIVTARG